MLWMLALGAGGCRISKMGKQRRVVVQVNALKAIVVNVSLTPGRVWIFSVT